MLSKYTNNRDNNFNLIRFIAASLVLYSHNFPLSGIGGEPFVKYLGISGGEIAVDIFFISSGFLIAGSFFERNNIGAFIWARILRIYPALIMAVFFCTFIVGLFFTKESWLSYIDDPIIYKFFVKNITLLFGVEYYLPSVFNENPYKNAVNGSIWTLPYEIKMYSYLAISGIILNYLEKFIGNWLVKISFLLVAVFVIITYILEHFNLPTQEPFFRLFLMFFTGVAFYLWRGYVCMSKSVFIVLIIILSISIVFNKQLFFIGYIIFLPYLVFYVAYIPSGFVRNFNKFGDYSYGIYLYAFPVSQSIAAVIPNISLIKMVCISFIVTFLLSILSWHLIEKRFLKIKGNYSKFEKLIFKIIKITKKST
jgi:peptidoglycan/LPS O-acetylase OafA/YrhL